MRYLQKALATTAICFLLTGMSFAESNETTTADQSLKAFLRKFDADQGSRTEYSAALVDLNDDGKQEAVVYLTGPSWCGSGGCTAVILVPKGASYKVVSRMSITWPPIRVLETKTNGWHDLTAWVEGGGIHPGYEAKLSFNGRTYPNNPSGPVAKRLTGKTAGQIIISSDAKREPLYER